MGTLSGDHAQSERRLVRCVLEPADSVELCHQKATDHASPVRFGGYALAVEFFYWWQGRVLLGGTEPEIAEAANSPLSVQHTHFPMNLTGNSIPPRCQ